MANSFHFSGRIAAAPVMTRPSGDAIVKFTLIRNESRGKEEGTGEKRDERVVDIQFTAFRGLAETIAQHCFVGDQLEVTARLENNNFTKDGVERFGYNFVVQEFDFGAPGAKKREMLAEKQQQGQRGG